jgi:hypothetical protein
MDRSKRILLLSNSELDQANCFLAVSHVMMQLDSDLEVHFASYAALKDAAASTSDYARRLNPKAKRIVFHQINALNSVESLAINGNVGVVDLIEAKPRNMECTSDSKSNQSHIFAVSRRAAHG